MIEAAGISIQPPFYFKRYNTIGKNVKELYLLWFYRILIILYPFGKTVYTLDQHQSVETFFDFRI